MSLWNPLSRKKDHQTEPEESLSSEAEVADAFVSRTTDSQDNYGMKILYSPESADDIHLEHVVIAVHGLGGGNISTWTDKGTGTLWLRDYLKDSPQYKAARIMSFGYDARPFLKPFEPRTTSRIFTFGEELVSILNDYRIDAQARSRPILFVGHSLGGIVIKSALVYAKSKPTLYSSITDATKAIIFFGTPHQGADIANLATAMGRVSETIGLKSTTVMHQLNRWSDTLVELTTMFSEQIPDLLVTTFFEKLETYGVLVVREASARLGNLKNEVVRGLDRNHLTICKFANKDEDSYRAIQQRFDAVATQISDEAPGSTHSLQQRLDALQASG